MVEAFSTRKSSLLGGIISHRPFFYGQTNPNAVVSSSSLLVLRPVGQLIISAAVIDDMIALVVLSQLEALVGELTVASILIPVVSAVGFLILGGYAAIFILPPLIEKHILSRFKEENHARVEMAIMFAMVLALMPATYYAKASYLMGCFVAGLTFCSSHALHHLFVRQFKRLLQWLMRIFFAASIGFQVPIKDFADTTIIWQGLVYTLALLGKVGVGFMVPNFTQGGKFRGNHLRDCLITGFSMAAEGEFAFVIAVFAVDAALIHPDLYASVVLAVLLSTIIPPFLLRFTISYYNKKGQETVERAAEEENMRKHILGSEVENALVQGIRNNTTVFLCIQTQSESKWGLLPSIMAKMGKVRFCFAALIETPTSRFNSSLCVLYSWDLRRLITEPGALVVFIRLLSTRFMHELI